VFSTKNNPLSHLTKKSDKSFAALAPPTEVADLPPPPVRLGTKARRSNLRFDRLAWCPSVLF
jgi:hypothetical protein